MLLWFIPHYSVLISLCYFMQAMFMLCYALHLHKPKSFSPILFYPIQDRQSSFYQREAPSPYIACPPGLSLSSSTLHPLTHHQKSPQSP
ncbi:hypothetical protein B0T20DRAFT_417875 [Sordaria brevicollis]|uniref:Uncharacterized protein n=1 Tax=Sordaria brevicollis TaxID=83679 RepID=A0AAE0PAY8_SORBR|nr:hypothetical protein B0T20DRAFT_417875 [Sordaria brevicollis]